MVSKPSESEDQSTSRGSVCPAGDGQPSAISGEGPQAVSQHEGRVGDVFDAVAQDARRRAGTSLSHQEGQHVPTLLMTERNTCRADNPFHAAARSGVQSRAAEVCARFQDQPINPGSVRPHAVNAETAEVWARFLPQVETICDHAVDPWGRTLPPCIVMEKGESLQDWSNRAEPDLFTSLAVRPPTL